MPPALQWLLCYNGPGRSQVPSSLKAQTPGARSGSEDRIQQGTDMLSFKSLMRVCPDPSSPRQLGGCPRELATG